MIHGIADTLKAKKVIEEWKDKMGAYMAKTMDKSSSDAETAEKMMKKLETEFPKLETKIRAQFRDEEIADAFMEGFAESFMKGLLSGK